MKIKIKNVLQNQQHFFIRNGVSQKSKVKKPKKKKKKRFSKHSLLIGDEPLRLLVSQNP